MALDVANTVVRRNDPLRRIDRLEKRENIEAFVEAAVKFRRNEISDPEFAMPTGERDVDALINLRERIDQFVRAESAPGSNASDVLAQLFGAAAIATSVAKPLKSPRTFGSYVAVSAMKLLDERFFLKCKICPDCEWLFVDQSKNQSRMWCDMAVCGNRAKAKAHYARVIKNNSAISSMQS